MKRNGQFASQRSIQAMISFILALTSLSAMAFPSSESRNTFKSQRAEVPSSSYFTSLGLDLSSNLYSDKSYERQSGLDVTLSVGYLWSPTIYSAVSGAVSTDLRGQQNSTLSNFKFVNGNKYSTTESFKAQYYVYGVAPTNEEARSISNFKGGVGVGHSMETTFKNLIIPYALKLGIDLQKNFHEYDLAADGLPNSEMSVGVAPGLTFKFSDKISLMLTGTYLTARSYQGAIKQKFDTDILAGIQLSKQVSCNFGIANRGDLLKANGTDSNFSIFNDQSNLLHAGFVWQN